MVLLAQLWHQTINRQMNMGPKGRENDALGIEKLPICAGGHRRQKFKGYAEDTAKSCRSLRAEVSAAAGLKEEGMLERMVKNRWGGGGVRQGSVYLDTAGPVWKMPSQNKMTKFDVTNLRVLNIRVVLKRRKNWTATITAQKEADFGHNSLSPGTRYARNWNSGRKEKKQIMSVTGNVVRRWKNQMDDGNVWNTLQKTSIWHAQHQPLWISWLIWYIVQPQGANNEKWSCRGWQRASHFYIGHCHYSLVKWKLAGV